MRCATLALLVCEVQDVKEPGDPQALLMALKATVQVGRWLQEEV